MINDINPELVNFYQLAEIQTDALVRMLQKHKHDKNYYLKIRNLDRQESGLALLSPL